MRERELSERFQTVSPALLHPPRQAVTTAQTNVKESRDQERCLVGSVRSVRLALYTESTLSHNIPKLIAAITRFYLPSSSPMLRSHTWIRKTSN
jgi:hypothetical protein